MKKLIGFFTVLLLSSKILVAQNVAINTSGAIADASAMLDVNSTNKGLLIPRVALTATNVAAPVATPLTSLMVYNTATAGAGTTAVTPGYYYWNGTIWTRFAYDGEAWKVIGNAGTNTTNNFIGTTDNVGLMVRTNNANVFEFTNNGRLRSFNSGTAALPTFSWNGDSDVGMYSITTNTLGFSTNGNERMRVAANGNVGINDIPNANNNILTSLQTTTTGTAAYIYTSANTMWVNLEANSASTTQGTGVRGLGFTGVAGDPTSAAGWAGYFSYDTYIDWMFYTGATLVSDRRLKSNIEPIENALGIITMLEPVNYDKKRGAFELEHQVNVEGYKQGITQVDEYGFIAQEIEKVLPQLVREKGMIVEGEMMDVKGVNYTMLIPILTQGIKDQQKIIESLEKRITILEGQLNQKKD